MRSFSLCLTACGIATLGLGALTPALANLSRPVSFGTRASVIGLPARAVIVNPNTSAAPTEIGNWWVRLPNGPQPTDFEVLFNGDVTSDIPNNEPTYGIYNPFCPPSRGPNNPCPPTVTFNPTTNVTTVEYFGTTLYQNSHQGQYHFGLLQGQTGSSVRCFVRTLEWTYPSSSPVAMPYVNICNQNKQRPKHKFRYATVYVEASFSPITASNPATFGLWYDIGYQPHGTQQPRFTFSNGGSQTIYVGISGIVLDQTVPGGACLKEIVCPANMKLLSQLNFGPMPPPGSPGSPFIPMTYPPPKTL
ncbi:MAG: hypothetical protein JO060_11205 [Candidatus Eremiobacteraeota bacterium]|nr:hypothetical protein [Candidatus Eremiobacteraeota bacterium]MBV9647273.1 hypothetical protein [Candidatus Eremiobacteraeota bacterium]